MENLRELTELTEEELKKLYEENKEFSGLVYELAYEDAMTAQAEQGELMGAKAFNMHDHYNSFYLTTPSHYGVKDGLSVAGALDIDYLNNKAAGLYKELCEIKETYENLTAEELDEQGEELEERANKLCDELADVITEDLRSFENITDFNISVILDFIMDGALLSGFKTDGQKVYEYITKIYK